MGNELIILTGGNLPPVSTDEITPDDYFPPDLEPPLDPFENAALLFDNRWQEAQAAELRNNLLALIFGGEENVPTEYYSHSQHQNQQTSLLLNQTLNSLINLAQDHKDFENFRAQPKEFWEQVRTMSEVRVVETYINGKLESRAVSRYGELLAQLNRQGGRMDNFLASLPASEREIFQARYQLNQTFGANELFVGNGIALDKNGQFPVRVFLSSHGKNPELSPHSVLSLLGGDLTAEEFSLLKNASLFTNGQVLFSAKSAALLGLSFALYQNINALLSLEDVALNALLPKNLSGTSEQFAARLTTQNAVENGKVNARSAEAIVVAAFINGTLATIYKYRKFGNRSVGLWAGSDSENLGFGFSAGATGAMMGASIGCIAPLAEKSVGEILGFAASVVVGLTDSGLRSLGANTIVAVITSGVQNFLDAASGNRKTLESGSPNKFLNAANAASVFENDLRQRLFNSRVGILSTT